MKKLFLSFAGGALATIFGLMAIPAPKTYPATLIVTKAVHKDDFSGYFVAERYTDTLYRNEKNTLTTLCISSTKTPKTWRKVTLSR